MGASFSAFREEIQVTDKANKKEIKEQLDFLVKATTAKLDSYQSELEKYACSNPHAY
jgi:hypothetical protein